MRILYFEVRPVHLTLAGTRKFPNLVLSGETYAIDNSNESSPFVNSLHSLRDSFSYKRNSRCHLSMSTFSWYDMYWQPRSRNIYICRALLCTLFLCSRVKETDQHFIYFDLFTITCPCLRFHCL